MNDKTKLNFSELPDDKLALLWVDAADQVGLRDEVGRRVDQYLKMADDALKAEHPDYDDALDKLERALLLNNASSIADKIKKVEKEQEEKRIQIINLSYDLENRLKQREDMNKLKKAINDAEKLTNDGSLPQELRVVFNKAKEEESKSREVTGQVTTKGRTGNMKESKEAYDFLLSVKQGKTNRSEVWDDLNGVYISIKSDAFETLLEQTKNHWKKETEVAIHDFKTDPKGDYLLKIDSDPTLVQASFERHFGHGDTYVVHSDCSEEFKKLKDEIGNKCQLYREAQGLYKGALSSKDPINAYEKILMALSRFRLEQLKEAGFRKRAQNFAFERLKKDIVQANELIEKFEFDKYQNFINSVWAYSNQLADLQQQDASFLQGTKETENYASRLATYQQKFAELQQRHDAVKKNYERIEAQVKDFEKSILDADTKHKINADDWWNKLNNFLERESEILDQSSKEKMYLTHFRARIDSLKKELIPLQTDQRQLELMKACEQEPEKWADVLSTDERLRTTYPEAAEIYSRVFIKSNLAKLDACLRGDDFITARECLNDLYDHDSRLRSELTEQENKVKEAEDLTTPEIHDFFGRASQLANSNEIASMIEGWKMHQYLVPESRLPNQNAGWPNLSGESIYTALSRNKVVELVQILNKEAKNVTDLATEWITDKRNESVAEQTREFKKATRSKVSENDPEFIRAANNIQLLRENRFLTSEQVKICKFVEFRRAKWLADQYLAKNNYQEANIIWDRMKLAYASDDDIEKEALATQQQSLLFQLTELVNAKDYQGAIDRINEAERINIAIVAQSYEIRLKHALAFEGLKQFENALQKLDDIKPDLLKLNIKEIKIIELERERLQIEHKIDRGIKKYQNACDRERERYGSTPGFFNTILIHLSELKMLRDEHSKHTLVGQYFQGEVDFHVNELQRLIKRSENILRDEVRRDVFLHRLALKEFKTAFAAKVDEKLLRKDSNRQEFREVCDFIEAEFDKVNPAEDNHNFDLDEAERLAGSLSARDMAELMQRYCEQFNQLLKFDGDLEDKTPSIKAKSGEAVYIFDKLMELCERAEVETSWEYALRNAYESRAWEAYFNGKTITYGAVIPQIKKRIKFIQRYLDNRIVEIEEFNHKINDADLIKPEIENKINKITNGYSAYLDQINNGYWSVSTEAQEILTFSKAIPDSIRTKLQYIQREVYPVIIGFYNRTIAFTALDPEWSWIGFDECISKSKKIEDNFQNWHEWSQWINSILLSNQKARELADWAGQKEVTVPWQNEVKRSDVATPDIIPLERNWYLQVFSTNESWEIISPTEEKFVFKYKLDGQLPKTYQLWLWENAQTKNTITVEMLKKGPVPHNDPQLCDYPAYALAAQAIKSTRQKDRVLLESSISEEIRRKIAALEKIIAFPTLPELDNWLRQGQLSQLGKAIDKGKEMGPRNKREADYLRAKEADLRKKEEKSGGFSSWFRSRK